MTSSIITDCTANRIQGNRATSCFPRIGPWPRYPGVIRQRRERPRQRPLRTSPAPKDPCPEPPSRLPIGRIVEFLEDRPGPLAKVVMALRTLVLEEAPGAAESVHWGALSYHDPECGGHVKGAVCQITLRGGRVRLSFIHGVRLPDPAGLLQGDRTSKRFVELRSAAEIPDLSLRALVRSAAECVRT